MRTSGKDSPVWTSLSDQPLCLHTTEGARASSTKQSWTMILQSVRPVCGVLWECRTASLSQVGAQSSCQRRAFDTLVRPLHGILDFLDSSGSMLKAMRRKATQCPPPMSIRRSKRGAHQCCPDAVGHGTQLLRIRLMLITRLTTAGQQRRPSCSQMDHCLAPHHQRSIQKHIPADSDNTKCVRNCMECNPVNAEYHDRGTMDVA